MSLSKFDKLRHRPFLIVERITQPAAGVRTNRKNWNKDPDNLYVTDRPYIANRISPTILRHATIIIDIINDTVIKNRLRDDATAFDDEVLKQYKSKCSEMIEAARNQWIPPR